MTSDEVTLSIGKWLITGNAYCLRVLIHWSRCFAFLKVEAL